MARMSEAKCKEMIRGGTSRMLYPYPEHEKPFSVVILDTSLGDMEMEVLPFFAAPAPYFLIHNRLLPFVGFRMLLNFLVNFLMHHSIVKRSFTLTRLRRQSTASWSVAGAAIMSHVCLTGFKRLAWKNVTRCFLLLFGDTYA